MYIYVPATFSCADPNPNHKHIACVKCRCWRMLKEGGGWRSSCGSDSWQNTNIRLRCAVFVSRLNLCQGMVPCFVTLKVWDEGGGVHYAWMSWLMVPIDASHLYGMEISVQEPDSYVSWGEAPKFISWWFRIGFRKEYKTSAPITTNSMLHWILDVYILRCNVLIPSKWIAICTWSSCRVSLDLVVEYTLGNSAIWFLDILPLKVQAKFTSYVSNRTSSFHEKLIAMNTDVYKCVRALSYSICEKFASDWDRITESLVLGWALFNRARSISSFFHPAFPFNLDLPLLRFLNIKYVTPPSFFSNLWTSHTLMLTWHPMPYFQSHHPSYSVILTTSKAAIHSITEIKRGPR